MSTFSAPTSEQVKAAVRRIPTLQLRRAFFEGLNNPLWVSPLAREGIFSNPPEPEHTEDGYIRDVYWPEIDYLIRVAPDAPEAVVDVLLKLGKSNNAWVRRGAFEIGAAIPAVQAARLKPLIQSWLPSGLGWRVDPRSLVTYTINLLVNGQANTGKWFASLIFKPLGSTSPVQPNLVLEDYWYEEGLSRLVTVLGHDDLGMVLSWLVAHERSNGHLSAKSDYSNWSRESIRQGPQASRRVEHALIDAVRDIAIDAMLADPSVAKQLLLGSKMLLARKIALFSLSEALGRIATSDERRDGLLTVAFELLSDPGSADDSCRIDYAELARAVARTTGAPIDAMTGLIERGDGADPDQLRDWVRDGSSDEVEVDTRVQEYTDHWRHRWLSAIGTDALPAILRSELADLDRRYGAIADPLRPSVRIESWTGPNSPLGQDEMAAMAASELVAHLQAWHVTGEAFGPRPSHEGQGRELSGLLTTNPTSLEGIDNLVGRLRPTYIRAILTGWAAARKANLALDWQQVAALLQDVIAHDDNSSFPAEGLQWDDDADYRFAKNAAVSLLVELARRRTEPTIPDLSMSQFAALLIEMVDDAAWIEYVDSAEESSTDALTMSLNRQWPSRLRGLINLLSHGKDAPWFERARISLEAELERGDPGGASWAVVGEGLWRLVNADAEWVEANSSAWFGSGGTLSTSQQIALTTAIATHHYHPTLYSLLDTSMIAAIESEEPVVAGWNTHSDPLQRIGEWAIHAIVSGGAPVDDPLAQMFFAEAPAKVRGEAIGHSAWEFMHAETIDVEVSERLGKLWDRRVAHVQDHPEDNEELSGFHWFVKCKKFSTEWWLPRLRQSVELNQQLSRDLYMISSEVAIAAAADPQGAFYAMRQLFENANAVTEHPYANPRTLAFVIGKAIASDDEALKHAAIVFMNRLGELGHLDIEAEVQQVQEGVITVSEFES